MQGSILKWLSLLGLVAFGAATPVFSDPLDGWSGGNSHMSGWWGGGLMMLIFWGVVIGVIVMIIRTMVSKQNSAGTSLPAENPLEILRARFARGEIDEDEFLRRKKLLEE